MDYSLRVIKQTVIMSLIICVGILCYKRKLLNDEAGKKLSGFVLNVVAPCFMFMSYQIEFSPDRIKGLLTAFALSLAVHIVFIAGASLIIRKKDSSEYIIERFSVIYTNCGFVGIPLIDGVFGSEGVFYATAYLALFNIIVWTHGLLMMKGSFSKSSILSLFKSPVIISVFLGLACYLTGFRMPEILSKPIDYIASMNTPLAMITAGTTIAKTSFRNIVSDKRALYVSFLRLFLLPAAVIVIFSFLPISDMIYMPVMLSASCPTAAIGTLFAMQFDKNAVYASKIFSVTAVASAVSMPVMILLMSFLR